MPLTDADRKKLIDLARRLVIEGVTSQPRLNRLRTGVPAHLRRTLALPTTTAAEQERLKADNPDPDDRRRLLIRLMGAPTVEAYRDAMPAERRPTGTLRPPSRVLIAASRIAIEREQAHNTDKNTVNSWLTQLHDRRQSMSNTYRVEDRAVPDGYDVQKLEARVSEVLKDVYNTPQEGNESFHAVVIGKVLLEGQLMLDSAGFDSTIRQAFLAGLETTEARAKNADGTPKRIPNHRTYAKVDEALRTLPGHGESVAYQELASIAEHIIDEADQWPVDDTGTFGTRVQLGLQEYVEGTADVGFAALELPAIVSDDASEQEVEPGNVQAVAMIAAAAELESAGVFDVVDRMVELFLQGMLPVGNDPGGAALNRYYWNADERLDPGARAAQYARVLGTGGGGEASKDVQPNTQFADLLFRFVGSIARYDADMRVSSLFDNRSRDLPASSEFVRKAAHDLAANASLYGWGFTTFAAKSLARHIDLAFDVLSEPTLQRAYGVTGPWQLIERVASLELGAAPNIVQHRTMAKATKDILDLLAKHSRKLSLSGANERFLPGPADFAAPASGFAMLSSTSSGAPPAAPPMGTVPGGSAIPREDYDKLANAAHNILAVNGIGTDEIDRMAKPTRTSLAPSIPVVGGNGGNGGSVPVGFDQIAQMVKQGQYPSQEQLQRLFASAG